MRLLDLDFATDSSPIIYYWDWVTDSMTQWLIESDMPVLLHSRETSSRAVVASRDGMVVMADSDDATVSVSNFEMEDVLSTIELPSNIDDLLLRDTLLIIVHDKGTLVWDFEESTLVSELDLPHHRFSIWYSPSGTIIAYPEHGLVKIMDILADSIIAQFRDYFGIISDLTFNPITNEMTVAYLPALQNGYVRIRQNGYSGVEAFDIAQGEYYITAIAYSRDGERLAYAYLGEQFRFGITIWNGQTQASTPLLQSACDGRDYPACGFYYLEFSPTSKNIVGIFNIQWFSPQAHNYVLGYIFDSAQQLEWDFEEDDNSLPVEPSSEFVEGYFQRNLLVNFQPETNVVAYNGLFDYAVRLYDIETQETPITLYSHTTAITALQFSPDGTMLVSGDSDGNLIVWDMVQEQVRVTLPMSDANINAIDFHPDGQHIAIATGDHIWVYDLTTMQEVAAVEHDNIEFLDFNHDGTMLSSANHEGVLKLWEVE